MLGGMNINPYSRALIAVALLGALVGGLALLGKASVLAAVAFVIAGIALLMWILVSAMKWRTPDATSQEKNPS